MIISMRFFRLLHLHVLVVLVTSLSAPTLGLSSGVVGDATNNNVKGCIERERRALLQFKHGLIDYGRLSSWGSEEDCCKWSGVRCSNRTGHVTMLHLHDEFLGGNISSSLLELRHLNYLDLSLNYFFGSSIPEFIGLLSGLQYLNLSHAYFNGTIPYQLGNLTNLQFLDLSDNGLKVENLEWLSHLSLLKTLDLSYVNLSKVSNWVEPITKLPLLTELRLTYCQLSGSFSPPLVNSTKSLSGNPLNSGGTVPYQLGNLTNLHFLDLDWNDGLKVENLEWLSHLSLLKTLDLSFVNLSKVSNWVEPITNLPLLTKLILMNCELSDVSPSSLLSGNSTKSLSFLDLSGNSLNSSSIYHWLFNSSHTLKHVGLSRNNLQGMIPDAFGNMISLEHLDLSENQLEGGVPKTFRNLNRLQFLDLFWNSLNVPFPELLQSLSGQTKNSLQILRLNHNELTGSIPNVALFSSLSELDLSFNELNGSFSRSFAIPSSLEILDLSLNQIKGSLPRLSSSSLKTLYLSGNQLEGVVSEAHFSNISNLQNLDLSRNSLVLKVSPNWLPPFQLDIILLAHCKLGPHFPRWLRTLNKFSQIDISDNQISDTVPRWFWDKCHEMMYLNLSHNQIYGMLPDLSLVEFTRLDLSYNSLQGPVPLFHPSTETINLSNNMFSGPISLLCNFTRFLIDIDLSDNLLSGEIPDCWMGMELLAFLNLANNNFFGKIPSSMGYPGSLRTLQLRNNSLTGELPLSLGNCGSLIFIDLSENSISGTIPEWLGTLPSLIIFTARSNRFYGTIPSSICGLPKIQVLDLSLNKISGNIPKCLNNLSAMAKESSSDSTISDSDTWLIGQASTYENTGFLVWKGTLVEYKSTLGLVKGIDLSRNKLIGKIPEVIAELVGLRTLNLSGNGLTGGIPLKIGNIVSLESLDLSDNHLSGKIPTSLSQISSLSVLDLSNNNLSGKIPLGTQLQSFNASSFMGNPDLCGAPLEGECLADKKVQDPPNAEQGLITRQFYVSMGLGFIFGFWGVCLTLVLNSSWRHAFFKLLERIEAWFFVMFRVYMARLKRQLRKL